MILYVKHRPVFVLGGETWLKRKMDTAPKCIQWLERELALLEKRPSEAEKLVTRSRCPEWSTRDDLPVTRTTRIGLI